MRCSLARRDRGLVACASSTGLGAGEVHSHHDSHTLTAISASDHAGEILNIATQKGLLEYGLVHAWVGQILLNCNVFKRGNSSVPLSDDLSATRQLTEATADLS